MQKKIIKLTNHENQPILIGVESIIEIESKFLKHIDSNNDISIIKSRGAMITTNYVMESIEEIYNLINN